MAAAALALIAGAYWPGLQGPFLFDDFGNLNVLGTYGSINNWPAFLYYITSGGADPTGRPVALLSFLLDAQTWPAPPWPFKRTNLLLHLLNTALLTLAVNRLQAGLQRRRPDIRVSRWTPLLAAALWGAHPFFVSTTLYVVQREAMLPMTFVLLALLAWDRAVARFEARQNVAGWVWATLGMGGATLLAGLSKANGLLAPLLIGLAYLWWLRPMTTPDRPNCRPMDSAAVLCLGLPSLLLLAYLVLHGWQLWSLPQLGSRDWTLPERLLSEPRAIWRYVGQLVVPRAGGGGIYVEGFAPSRGLLQPASTLAALAALFASVIAALALRRRWPIVCFAWLFFLAGHLMESSTIALELYFEHRNYLPAMFLGWPIAHVLLRPADYRNSRLALAASAITGLLLLTHQRAEVWGDPVLLGALSVVHQPDSARSQVYAARQEIDRGDLRAALTRVSAVQHAQPDSVDIAIAAIGMECATTGALRIETLARARKTLSTARRWNYALYEWLQDAASSVSTLRCRGFGLDGIKALVAAAESNRQNYGPTRKRDLWHVRGRIALTEGNPQVALHWFDAALEIRPSPEYALVQAAALGNAGAPALGVRHLDHYARIDAGTPPIRVRNMASAHQWVLRHYGYYRTELSRLRRQMQADAKDSGGGKG